ncbi:MAG: hypothetical protein QM765_26355 [Myxococcales bacterium]
MSENKCHRCGAPATRQRMVVVKEIDHHDDHHHHPHDHHHHHSEVVTELRPVCADCDAALEAQGAAVLKVATGVAGGIALMALMPLVLAGMAFLAVAGGVVWFLLRAH